MTANQHSYRRRKAAAAACSLVAFAAAGIILLPDRDDETTTNGYRFSPNEDTRILPSRSASHTTPQTPSSSSSLASSIPILRGTNPNGLSGSRTVRTFYEPLPQYTPPQRAEHDGQVELWRRAWTEAGWDARVLTLDDARRHPRYEEMMSRIDALDWCGPKERKAEFQKSCFVRWLAYSADGAGFVSDYDILPLNFGLSPRTLGNRDELPNGGEFTAYDPILASFASSGSGEEYERVLEAMLDAAEEHRKPRRPEDEKMGLEGRRSRGMECPASEGDSNNGEKVGETKWQITDMQALQVLKYAMWKGSKPKNMLHVPAVHDEDRPPCTFVVNEIEFEEWTISHPGSCPGAVHFSGKPGMERDERLETSRAMWEEWSKMCSTRTECSLPREWEGDKRAGKRRGIMLNLAAGASVMAAAIAAMR